MTLGKPIDGVEGQLWRVLSDLFRAAPVAPAAAASAERFDLRFPTVLRKMWSGCEVQAWLDELPPLYEVPTHARDDNTGNASLIGGAPVELVQFTPAQAAERAGLETPARLSTDAVAQLSTETVDKPVQRMSDAERDVLAERARQVSVEGWTPTRSEWPARDAVGRRGLRTQRRRPARRRRRGLAAIVGLRMVEADHAAPRPRESRRTNHR